MLPPVFGVLFDGLAYGTLLFVLSVGLSVTLGLMNFVNLAHCAFAMLGGYVTVTLTLQYHWPFLATLPAACVAAAAASVVLERILYRRLYRATDLDQVLLTIGIAFISVAAAAYIYGTLQQPIETPAFLRGAVGGTGLAPGKYRLFLIVVALIVTGALVAALDYTRFGAQVRAEVDNQRMARGLGIDVERTFAATFAHGSGLAGHGGAHLRAEARVVERGDQRAGDDQRDDDEKQPVLAEGEAHDADGAAQEGGRLDRLLQRAVDVGRGRDRDEGDADRQQHLIEIGG